MSRSRSYFNIERHFGDEAAALLAVSVVGLDVPDLNKLMEHTLGVVHRPVAVDAGVYVDVFGLLHPFLVHALEEVAVEVALPGLSVPPLVGLAQRLWVESFVEDGRGPGETQSTHVGGAVHLGDSAVVGHLVVSDEALANQVGDKISRRIRLGILLARGVSGSHVVKAGCLELAEEPLSVLGASRTHRILGLNLPAGA